MRSKILRTFALSLVIALAVHAHAQGDIEKKKCNYPTSADGNFGDCPGCTYGSWVTKKAETNENVYHRCIENPAASRDKMWTHWEGILSSSRIPIGHRLYGYTTMAEPRVVGNTNFFYDQARKRLPQAQAKCWRGEKACKGSTSDKTEPSFLGFSVDGSSATEGDVVAARRFNMETTIGERRALVEAYREFFVAVDSTKPDDLIKFAFAVKSRQSDGAIAYTTAIYASKDILQRTMPGNQVLFKFSTRQSTPLQLQERSLSHGLMREAAQSGFVRLHNTSVSARRVRVAEIAVDVHDSSGQIAATFTVPLLEPY